MTVKKYTGVEAEIDQVKTREKELQRIIDEYKAENDGLRAKVAAGSSNEGSSKRCISQAKLLQIR